MPTMLFQGREEQVVYSAVTFRCLLDSLARPGKINQLPPPALLGDPPCYQGNASEEDNNVPVNLYALGTLATLLDGETSFALAANGDWLHTSHAVTTWLALRSGSRAVAPGSAHFALFCDGRSNGLLLQLSQGSLLEPETSATAFYCVERLVKPQVPTEDAEVLANDHKHHHNGAGDIVLLELSGPGIQEQRMLTVYGFSQAESELIQTTRRSYPLGIDIFLIDADGRCVGFPRMTTIKHFHLAKG